MKVLVTGAAGFIGYHAAQRLLGRGDRVTGADNFNPYYDPALKRARVARLAAHPRFELAECDLADPCAAAALFKCGPYDAVLHLAAQPGVRYSLEHPRAYTEANITATLNLLEGCRAAGTRLVYASSSSVYGGSRRTPFRVGDPVDRPVSLYAATKRAGELMAHCYTHLFGFGATGLRFFTVYGPWGRPDMAPFRFVEAMARGRRIEVYNYGRMQRDFTYIDDVAEAIVRVLDRPQPGHHIYNVGNAQPVALLEFIGALETAFGRRARRRYLPLQPGDVLATHADSEPLFAYTGFRPATPVAAGAARFVDWYRAHYQQAATARVA